MFSYKVRSTKYIETVKTIKRQLKLHRVMYITNICNMFRHTTLFCYVHLLNVTYVHKNFISCLVGLSFQKLKLLKNNHKILRPTTLISCRMMQEDWEGSDWQRKNSVLISVYIFVGLNICYYFRSYSPSFLESKTDEKTVGLNIFWRVGLNILVESVLIFSILVTRS